MGASIVLMELHPCGVGREGRDSLLDSIVHHSKVVSAETGMSTVCSGRRRENWVSSDPGIVCPNQPSLGSPFTYELGGGGSGGSNKGPVST